MPKDAGKQPDEQPLEKKVDGRAAHLKKYQFKKGQSGNPSGRPKGTLNIMNRLRKRLMMRVLDGTREDEQVIDQVIDSMVNELLAGNFKFMKELLDRDEGPIPKEHHIAGVDGLAGVVASIDRAMGDEPDDMEDEDDAADSE